MYSVFLADDERLIREGLAETLPWDSLGLSLVGMAPDGKQALQDIRERKPDIVLTDIRMPYMDGLELIAKIREIQPECRIVILTGYGEFEYAQTAIRFGVSDFLLKPIDISDLCRILRHIVQELDGIRCHKSELAEMRSRLQCADEYQFKRRLLRCITGREPLQQLFQYLPEHMRRARAFCLVLLQLDRFDSLTATMDEETVFSMTQRLEQSLEKAGERMQLTVVEEFSGRYLLFFTGWEAEELRFSVRSFIRRLRLIEPEMEFTTVTSAIYGGLADCQTAYEFVQQGSKYTFQLGSNRDVQMEELKDDAVNPLPDVPNVGRVIRSISTFDKKTILQDFQMLANDIRQTGHNSYLYTHMLVSVVYGEITKLLVDINCPIENILENPLAAYQKILVCATLDDMLEELFRFVAQICDFVNNHASANKSAADRAKVYIETHYADSSLTLDRVASAVGISPNYFSALFKQSTNCSFISYLTSVRIAHAKELLKSGSYKTYEVAMRCGYENPTYFSTIFKRQTGFSPSEYNQKA